jgi:RNA-directed DNA polymerase
VLSISPASERGRDDKTEDKEEMLERILSKDNLNLAYKRVKANKGSPGIDGKAVEELLPYLKQQGEGLRQKNPYWRIPTSTRQAGRDTKT